jgi:hypothetical protein
MFFHVTHDLLQVSLQSSKFVPTQLSYMLKLCLFVHPQPKSDLNCDLYSLSCRVDVATQPRRLFHTPASPLPSSNPPKKLF